MTTGDVDQQNRISEATYNPFVAFRESCKGRAGRKEFWKSVAKVLLSCAFGLPVAMSFMLVFNYFNDLHNTQSDLYRLSATRYIFSKLTFEEISLFFSQSRFLILLVVLPTLIRRSHDLGRSGWLLSPMVFLICIPYVDWLVWPPLLIGLGAFKGALGPNFYGPPPGEP